MKSRLVILLFAFVSIYIVCNRQEYRTNIYCYDASGYYRYLPSLFIYHDPGRMQFRQAGQSAGFDYDDDANFLYEQKETGKRTDKYAIGTSLFELPGFLAAYTYCSCSPDYQNDGYSLPFQVAGILSSILWVVLGLFILRKFLKNYFSENITCVVLLCIAFGTNLYYYTTFIQGMSHGYTFFLFCAILYETFLWYHTGKTSPVYWLGLLTGLVIITRPTNIVIIVVPLLWEAGSWDSLKQRIKLFRTKFKDLLVAGFIFLLVASVQMVYWKYTSGRWIYYSYGKEKFDFADPNIWNGLFSYRKGWFIYTPLAFVSMFGFYSLWKKNKKLVPSLLLYFVLIIYIVFCWENWWYGGGFGCRPLVESLALLSLPLGALTEQVFFKKRILFSALITMVFMFCIVLNLFQSYQYSLHIIHHDRMSRAYYWHVFGKTKIDFNQSEKYLMDEKEYWRINKSINN